MQDKMKLPENALTILRDCIRSSDRMEAEWLSVLISRYQLCSAQYIDVMRQRKFEAELDSARSRLAAQWSVLDAICKHIFPFAIGEATSVKEQMVTKSIGYLHDHLSPTAQIHSKVDGDIRYLIVEFGNGSIGKFRNRIPQARELNVTQPTL